MTSAQICQTIITNIEKNLIGKTSAIEIVISALISGGHVLLDDIPGTGKTTLANSLARSIAAEFRRIQFTPDLLPGDLTGINFFDPKTSEFRFKKGAMFTNILLADEINRATPRTQSALLEAMEEKSITLDGNTYKLEAPYFVIATQNPVETIGTFPLPEAQLDRFMVKLSLGYPTAEESLKMLKKKNTPVQAVVTKEDVLNCMSEAENVFVSDDILKYIINIAQATRENGRTALGLSSRGLISLLKLSRGYALVKGRDYVIPEDIKMLAKYAVPHRIILKSKNHANEEEEVVNSILDAIPVPTENFER